MAASWTLKTGALLVWAAAFGLSSCATGNRHQKPAAEPAKFVMYHWEGDGVQGEPSIVIYLDTQKAEFYRGKKLVGWTYVATGKPSHPTPSGKFRIIEKTPDKISNLYGKLLDVDGKVVDSDFNLSKEEVPEGHQFSPARMPMFQRLTNDGVGLHVVLSRAWCDGIPRLHSGATLHGPEVFRQHGDRYPGDDLGEVAGQKGLMSEFRVWGALVHFGQHSQMIGNSRLFGRG